MTQTYVLEVGTNLKWVLLGVGGVGICAYLLVQWWMTVAVLKAGRG